jgi:hypothetical protein
MKPHNYLKKIHLIEHDKSFVIVLSSIAPC